MKDLCNKGCIPGARANRRSRSHAVSASYLGHTGTVGRMACSGMLLAQVENRACQILPSPEIKVIRQDRRLLEEREKGKNNGLQNNNKIPLNSELRILIKHRTKAASWKDRRKFQTLKTA